MKTWKKCLAIVAAMGMTSSIWAQIPGGAGAAGGAGAGGAAAGGAGGATGAAGAAGGAAPASGGGTIWNFFGINKACLRECKIRFCRSNLGMLVGNSLKPASALSGGLIQPCCPNVLNQDILDKAAKNPDAAKGDAQAAAAKIAQDEAQAKERRAAVRYLGTVDCHYWGDVAEPALINSLRSDRNECVRWEAAMALGNGCCCTKKTIAALTISVYGVDKELPEGGHVTAAGTFSDGFPVETSERVKASALAALQHCLSCYTETVTPGPEKGPPPERGPEKPEQGPEKPEKPVARAPAIFQPTAYEKPIHARTMAQVIQDARQVTTTPTTIGSASGYSSNVQESNHTMSGVFSKAFGSTARQNEIPVDSAPVSSPPPPRYSGLLPWLTR